MKTLAAVVIALAVVFGFVGLMGRQTALRDNRADRARKAGAL